MTTLDDLLVLLPDNGVGAITAEHLRNIVAELWNKIEAVEVRVAAIEASGGGGAEPSVTARWQINPQIGQLPGGQQVVCDNGLFDVDTTMLRFAKVSMTNIDMTLILTKTTHVFCQQESDADVYVTYDSPDVAVDQGTYIELPVQNGQGPGLGPGAWQTGLFVFVKAAASG